MDIYAYYSRLDLYVPICQKFYVRSFKIFYLNLNLNLTNSQFNPETKTKVNLVPMLTSSKWIMDSIIIYKQTKSQALFS